MYISWRFKLSICWLLIFTFCRKMSRVNVLLLFILLIIFYISPRLECKNKLIKFTNFNCSSSGVLANPNKTKCFLQRYKKFSKSLVFILDYKENVYDTYVSFWTNIFNWLAKFDYLSFNFIVIDEKMFKGKYPFTVCERWKQPKHACKSNLWYVWCFEWNWFKCIW